MSVEQLSLRSYIAWLGCAMTAECLSIKKKELIKTIHTNYFNQSKNERKNKGETIIALETTAPRKLSLSELNVFVVVMLKKQGKIRKKCMNL